jgi:hypothetical protein
MKCQSHHRHVTAKAARKGEKNFEMRWKNATMKTFFSE